MAKVEFDPGIESVRGILMGTDPYYIRRYPDRDGGVMHIVQARPDRSGHTPSAAEKLARVVFAEKFGKQKHLDFLSRTMRGQLELFIVHLRYFNGTVVISLFILSYFPSSLEMKTRMREKAASMPLS